MAKDTTMGILAHILAIFLGFIGPLIILLIAKDEESKKHAKTALNWQLSLIIYFIVAGILSLILIGILLFVILGILNIIFCILAAVKASEGEVWKYPLSIGFLKA